jgi:excisionase family DNA binding protein
VRDLEEQITAIATRQQPSLSDDERAALMRLDADLEQAWPPRKRIVRAVLNEIVVRVDDGHIGLLLHWQGGDRTALKVKKNAAGRHRSTVAEETEALIRELARLMPDKTIGSLLNRAGKPTGRNNGWTQNRVCTFRNHRGIEVYREGERLERGELTLDEAATRLSVSPMTVLRMIRRGVIPAEQLCKGAPMGDQGCRYRYSSGPRRCRF